LDPGWKFLTLSLNIGNDETGGTCAATCNTDNGFTNQMSQAFTRNLLIVQMAPDQDPSDWIAIKQRIERNAPDIEVRIADNIYRRSAIEVGDAGVANHRQRNSATALWQVQRPSLVFSATRLIDYFPRGGTVFCGQVMGKDEQVRRLSSIGILTPRSEILTPATSYSRAEWGEYVIVKPSNQNSGAGVKLVRTMELAARYDELTADFDDQFLVETYIDHSEDGYPNEYRVLSMFGRALYCAGNRWGDKRPPLAEIADDPLGIIASNNKTMGGRVRTICNDPEIVSLGQRAHQAFPECPVIGVDIVRETSSGKLYVLEVNPHGVVWHLSSTLAKNAEPEHIRQLYAQFDALDLAAELLIQKTWSEAS
jgi:hypothetical protein